MKYLLCNDAAHMHQAIEEIELAEPGIPAFIDCFDDGRRRIFRNAGIRGGATIMIYEATYREPVQAPAEEF